MAKNFLAGVSLKAQNERNGFDMSYQNQFTAPFGMLLPCFFQRVNPDDKFKLSCESQTICDGLVKPAFMRLNQHIDYYFIPATQLWMPFDEFVTGQNSYFSSIVSEKNEGKVPAQVPTFQLQWLNTALSEWNSDTDDLGYKFDDGAVRLLDLLGYFNLSGKSVHDALLWMDSWQTDESRYNLFPLLCYQKVYYDYFRNPKYEDNFVEAYNLDDMQSGFMLTDLGDRPLSRCKEFFKIRYRWQKKDYFTQTQPSILPTSDDIGYKNLSSLVALNNLFNVPGIVKGSPNIQDNNSSAVNRGEYVATSGLIQAGATVNAANIASQGLSVQNIRFAFAYEKLLRRMREAGPDFDSQMLAQFGISPFDARHGKCTYIGGYTDRLSATDVTNMTGDNIGDLAGQINVYADNSGKILDFHAKEHGYIIGIYSTSVDNMYQSYRTSREVMLRDRFDWFNPVFENLGLQPVFQCERDYTDMDDHQTPKYYSYDAHSQQTVIGYVPRYSELKTHPDECHGLLCNYANVVGYKEWNVQVNTESTNTQALNKSTMLLDPAQFDAVSGVAYNGKQTTDHFVINMYTHSHKVSSMSDFETF